ncbi:DNA polymerase III subunit gamma/tau, partial [Trinickia symbiotica]
RAPSTAAAPVRARGAKVEAGSGAGFVTESQPASALTTGRPAPADSPVAARSVGADAHADEPATDAADKVSEAPRPAAIVANDAPLRPVEKETDAASDPGRGLDTRPRTNSAPVDTASPARTGGASAALEVLRSAGLRVSTDRGRARGEAAKAATAPAPKPAAPRVPVDVPAPRARREDGGPSAPAPVSEARERREPRAARDTAPTPPWDDAPPLDAAFDDYVPLSAEDTYFSAPDDGFAPPDDRTGGDARGTRESETAPAIDLTKLPAPVLLDTIGFAGDWPALAVDLGLTGVAHQLAFNSELTALEGEVLKLAVPVPQYAEAAQVAKLKAALAQRLGRPVEVHVEVGPARRTAAVLEAAARAERQREAEREIGADPFVQSLVREFGATIVPGSVKPLSPDTGASAR